jgi:hypothetical protein
MNALRTSVGASSGQLLDRYFIPPSSNLFSIYQFDYFFCSPHLDTPQSLHAPADGSRFLRPLAK